MMTVRGRSLPASVAAYRGHVEGVEGFVLSIDGRSCFLSVQQAKDFGAYLQTDEPRPDSQPISLHGLVHGQR